MISDETRKLLIEYADRYETKDFLPADPSWFMHQVSGKENKETMAFIASCLSYGSRKQFMKKIQYILDVSKGNIYQWVANGLYTNDIPDDDTTCFYRLYTQHTMHSLLYALQQMLKEYGSIGEYVKQAHADGKKSVSYDYKSSIDCLSAVKTITYYFSEYGIESIVPKNTTSACKRICMFMRWMVRDNSPVDLGLWSSFMDKKTLIVPMDTHVLQEANRLGLTNSKTASMSTAIRLTQKLSEIFPEDPMKGDFALFGYGVNH